MERKNCSVQKLEKIKTEEMRSRTDGRDIAMTIKRFKLTYAGHLVRDKKRSMERKLLEWTPHSGLHTHEPRWNQDETKVS